MTDREGKADAQPYHLILLAKDWTGYQNLCRLVTDAHLDGYYYKPRIDREHLAQPQRGPVGLSACLNGEVARALETEDWDAGPQASPASTATSSAGTGSSSSSRTTACPSSAGSTSSCCAWRRRSACRSSPPTTCTTSVASSPRRTTCCCASAPATTSTRPAG